MVSDKATTICSAALDPCSSSIARDNTARRLSFEPRFGYPTKSPTASAYVRARPWSA
jgi:hypothetical protein